MIFSLNWLSEYSEFYRARLMVAALEYRCELLKERARLFAQLRTVMVAIERNDRQVERVDRRLRELED
jgi:acyl-CoA thioesterase FadM